MCSSCRLNKCFASGMQIELIRGSRYTKNIKRQKKIIESTYQVRLFHFFKRIKENFFYDSFLVSNIEFIRS